MPIKLPLSKFQTSIWKGQKMRPDVPLYNMVFTFDIFGEINEALFIEAYNLVANNTSLLRLIVDETDPVLPLQKSTGAINKMEYIEAYNNFNLEEWLDEKNKINFDLKQNSYYTALLKLDEGHYVWYFNQHHIFTDAYSFQVVFEKMSKTYQELLEGKQNELSLRNDETEYIANFNAVEKDLQTQDQKGSSLRKMPFSLYGLKFENPNETESTRHLFKLSEDKVNAILAKLAALKLRTFSPNLDLLSFLMSALCGLIDTVGGDNKDIVISNIFSKRFTKNSKALARPLLEILDAKINFDGIYQFEDLYQEIYSFLIMRKKKEDQTLRLAPIIFNFFDLNFKDFADLKTNSKWHHCAHMDEHHYLRLHMMRYKAGDDFTLAFDIKKGHNSDTLAQRLISDFETTIDQFLKLDAGKNLAEICLLNQTDLEHLQKQVENCEQFKIEHKDYLSVKLIEQIKANPNKTALFYKTEEISYEVLGKKAIAIANCIRSNSNEDSSKVVVFLPRSENYVYAVLGCIFSNASFIPIPYSYPAQRAKYIVENIKADLIIHAEREIETSTKAIHIKECIHHESQNINLDNVRPNDNWYTLYTSGSTGNPKGVNISHAAFTNYIKSAAALYLDEAVYNMPLFTSIGFDLTMTSLFLPLFTAGSIHIYEDQKGIDLSIKEVINNKKLNCIKCTPSHLKLIESEVDNDSIKSIIVGGENFTTLLANKTLELFHNNVSIFNEYGPTEATVACIVYQHNLEQYQNLPNVPIGKTLPNYFAFIANKNGVPLPQGALGELCIGGIGLADSYVNDPELTHEKFINDNKYIHGRFYKTGDYAFINEFGHFEYLGRKDKQLKISGIRIESSEIEQTLKQLTGIEDCIVTTHSRSDNFTNEYSYCIECGLPSNYPTADFDESGTCTFCRSFESYKNKVEKYFKTENDFKLIFDNANLEDAEYDCIMLYSGGKDSTYALGKLSEMGLKVLAFTLDNGYISEDAKNNIKRIVSVLKVDHVFGTTPAMNEIFVDSLKTHCNVCNGCFKTIYNLSLKIAFQKNIPFIVTGLSRGQFFETKLSEEIFWKPMDDVKEIERTLFEARQAYHTVNDIVYEKTGGDFIENNQVLEKVKILDFYRYHDVTLENLLDYINTKLPWIRPDDTGRSTNCLINKVGIYVHKKEKGFSNYAFPYSWDVRTGHKTKEETIDEIEEYIDESEVKQIIKEIGFVETKENQQLVAYYKGKQEPNDTFKLHIKNYLPDYMVPSKYIQVDEFPLTQNGKVDFEKLKQIKIKTNRVILPPSNEIEEILYPIWQEVMKIKELSIDDDFFDLGGTSLDAIRIVARIEKTINYKLTVNYIFEIPTIKALAQHIMDDMLSLINANSE